MRKFEGNINGRVYTDENEFNNAIAEIGNMVGDVYVSYKYVSVPDIENAEKNIKSDNKKYIESNNIVSESQYIKNIINKEDVDIDVNLIEKLKNASNKIDISYDVCKKIEKINNNIEDNLLHINELKSDCKELDEKIKLINNQIKTLDDANNNYYLQKQYYTNIKDIVDTTTPEVKEDSCCECIECKCDNKERLSLKDEYVRELTKYLNDINNGKITKLSDLVEMFLK